MPRLVSPLIIGFFNNSIFIKSWRGKPFYLYCGTAVKNIKDACNLKFVGYTCAQLNKFFGDLYLMITFNNTFTQNAPLAKALFRLLPVELAVSASVTVYGGLQTENNRSFMI